MAAPNRSPMRVLIRPPPPPQPSTAVHHSQPPPSLPPLPPPPLPQFRQPGVVVIGFIGRRKHDVSQLINRVIDSNIFGSGDADVAFEFENEIKDWFKDREISYFYDATKGVLYLQFCSTNCPVMDGFSEVENGFDSGFEKQEFRDLQGMLFMFSVCHVIIFMQEGSHFDIQILKKFRVLQGAKNAMFPFSKSQTTSRSSYTSSSGPPTKNRSPGKNGPPIGRSNSSVALLSGLGSYSSLFPGQCTPVILFVFLDDVSDHEEFVESTSSGLNSSKGPGSVVVLSRPVSKPEGGFKKKLLSSLEAQIRFSIKKCRVLSGSETGSRNGPVSNFAPLFSLDPSKAVSIVDRKSNQKGKALEFATSIVEDVLNGISTSDSLLLDSHGQSSNKEDIFSVKEFIFRQCDILRGRGSTVSNASNVSGGGVGMVAVAAAAAAASVGSGKPSVTPDLPSVDVWLTKSETFLLGLLSAKPDPEQNKRKPRQRNNVFPIVEGNRDPLELSATYLDNSKGLNTRFSILWCERALPVARDVYLNDLPKCYPTSQHETHLVKALTYFKSMVKGPAVQHYMKKLEDECTSIWISGRQLCDSVSLTGKACIHLKTESKPHDSGFVFLHACACGRSRKLRLDPFDFETANVTFSCYPECDKLLPTLNLPKINIHGPIQSSSWSLIRIGGSRYYQPSKGLLQSGFSSTEKFLLKWKIFLEKHKESVTLPPGVFYSVNGSNKDSRVEVVSDEKVKNTANGVEIYSKDSKIDENKSNSARILPGFTMKKPFSEVVAGSSAARSSFPPLQSKKKTSVASENVIVVKTPDPDDSQESKKGETFSSVHETVDGKGNENGNRNVNGNPLLSTMNIKEQTLNQVVVYIGFEHECPCGHRFILTPDHLKGLGSIYAVNDESHHSSGENVDRKTGKNGGYGRVNRNSNRMVNRNAGKSKEQNSGIERSLQSMTLDDDGNGNGVFPLIDRNLPLYLNCPHCQISKGTNDQPNVQFAGTISQLQRIFLVTPPFPVVLATSPVIQFEVTPPFPVVLATSPVIQFEVSCLPPSVPEREQKLRFSLGCPVILPPESFLSLRLPFVYGVQLEDGSLYPLKPFESQPELTAWITKGTSLQVLSKGSNLEMM